MNKEKLMYTGNLEYQRTDFVLNAITEFFTAMSRTIHMCVLIAMKISIDLKHIRKERKTAMSILL